MDRKVSPEQNGCLSDIFTENGHSINTPITTVKEYLRNIDKPKSNDQKNTKNTENIIKLPLVLILGSKL